METKRIYPQPGMVVVKEIKMATVEGIEIHSDMLKGECKVCEVVEVPNTKEPEMFDNERSFKVGQKFIYSPNNAITFFTAEGEHRFMIRQGHLYACVEDNE